MKIAYKGQIFYIDQEDYDYFKAHNWYIQQGGYLKYGTKIDGKHKTFLFHREVVGGDLKGMQVDHINRNKLDNRKANLRVSTNSQNLFNRGKTVLNTSGYKGVTRRSVNRWIAQTIFCGTYLYLGSFDNPVEAARAYDKKALELHGEFACINFPEEHNVNG
jgi:HNH endonuclease/AP2 domain